MTTCSPGRRPATTLLRLLPLTLLAGLLLPATSQAAPPAAAPRLELLVCYPGGSVDPAQAQPALDRMLGVLQTLGPWPAGTFRSRFTADAGECRKLLAEPRPALAILSLGLYLEQRTAHHLLPLVQPRVGGRSTESWRVLVRKGTAHTLQELKGKTLGGTPLADLELLRRVVFAGRVDPASFFQLRPGNRALRALRQLAAGELDAVIVDEQQFTALPTLPFASQLEAVFSSAPMPLLGVTVDETLTPPADRQKLTDSLVRMCGHPEGKSMCELFGLDSFVAVQSSLYQPAIELWDARK